MDKSTATWLSHSSISSFKNCPRAYYLSNLYRDKRNNHKISIVSPALALGSSVHEVLESLSVLPTSERLKISLIEKFQSVWVKFSGQKGGFSDSATESVYKIRGEEMLRRVMTHPGPITKKAVKIQGELPQYWISPEDNIMLCGKLDWLEYDELGDTIRIIDFKTGVGEESMDSLQLPIYHLLAHNCQTKPVSGAAYWYIGRDDIPVDKPLPNLEKSRELVLKIGKEMKLAKSLNRFKCPSGEAGCRNCRPYEKIIRGEATYVGPGNWNQDVYIILDAGDPETAEIL